MSVNLITGKPGSGKTFAGTRLILDYLEYGHDVYTNIRMNVPDHLRLRLHFVSDRSQFAAIRSGILVLDEGQVWFNARSWAEMPEETQYKFQQHRHDDLHLWIITQNAKRLDLVIRELVVRFARARRLMAFRSPFVRGRLALQSPLLPLRGIGVESDPDYAKFVLEFFDMDDLTQDMRPRIMTDGNGHFKEVEPMQVLTYWMTPKRAAVFDTRQSQSVNRKMLIPRYIQ